MTAITKEKVLEAIRILAGRCGNAKIRAENKKIIMQYVNQTNEKEKE